ncbi:MAG: hypothetical protein H0V72_04655 [Bradyrhizobium sp.]|nr:hypothetical protein [Bradyrhizobium sp.]
MTQSQIMRGVFSEWAAGVISAERLAEETRYGNALTSFEYAALWLAFELRPRRRMFGLLGAAALSAHNWPAKMRRLDIGGLGFDRQLS